MKSRGQNGGVMFVLNSQRKIYLRHVSSCILMITCNFATTYIEELREGLVDTGDLRGYDGLYIHIL